MERTDAQRAGMRGVAAAATGVSVASLAFNTMVFLQMTDAA